MNVLGINTLKNGSIVTWQHINLQGEYDFFCPKLGPVEVFNEIVSMSGTKLNADIVKCFLSIVPMFPVGTHVRITTTPIAELQGCFGVISKVNPDRVHEPKVLVYESKNHQKIKPISIDFSKYKGFSIELA